MRLLLVRHGESHHSRDGLIAELSGCRRLTDGGHTQAQRLAERLPSTGDAAGAAAFLSSPSAAFETARNWRRRSHCHRWCATRNLCEVHPGEADGRTWDEYACRYGRLT